MATKSERQNIIDHLQRAGITRTHAESLRRVSMTLHRWHELECGNGDSDRTFSVERDEKTGKPFKRVGYRSGSKWKEIIFPTPDRERGALKRLDAIMSRYPTLTTYVQGDPRGVALYIIRQGDIPEGHSLESCYNYGLAVY